MNDALFSSDKNFWETPQKLFDELDAEFHNLSWTESRWERRRFPA